MVIIIAPMNLSAMRSFRPKWSARARTGRLLGRPETRRRAVSAASHYEANRLARPGRMLQWRSSSHQRSLM